ncbi:MAG: gfo/Idh/MocA family oxidoreductase [Proteobacteria bacterium]|nr:MAG: gfo/Idh/MocA family oxidoreductase [Pseudomonadota bacterium]
MSSSSARVAIIGCGRVSGHHCRSIARANHVELSAVCDLEAEKCEAYANEFSVPAYTDYRRMLDEHPDINVVAVITPSGMHREHSLEILKEYRRNIVVEKPTFMTTAELDEVYDVADELGLQVFPVFQNRHNSAVCRVKQGIVNGELGEPRVLSVRVRWCRPQSYYDLAPWRGTFAMDGGCLTNQGIHHIDLLRFFGGEISRVFARMNTFGAKIEVEDTVVAAVAFDSGALGNVEVTTAARYDDFEASLSLVCEKGLAQIGGKAVNELQIYTPDPEACTAFSEDFTGSVYGNGHYMFYEEVGAFFADGAPFSVTRDDNRSTIGLLNAFYVSDETASWINTGDCLDSNRLAAWDEELADLYRTPRND